jgi:hypothetical protein
MSPVNGTRLLLALTALCSGTIAIWLLSVPGDSSTFRVLATLCGAYVLIQSFAYFIWALCYR